ncbi:MAG: MoxR family ATPase [Candidatus Thermoplasmatota archaeon]|nr:MoxR family ATPase [Candidatus Thermoplasmatota archaeon]
MKNLEDHELYKEKFEQVKEEVSKVIIGYEDVIDDFLVCLMTGGHLLLEGVPGIAKTTMIKVFTKAVDLDYERIQFTQDMLPADISGHYYYDQKSSEFELRKGPVFAQVLMADEINRAPPKTQSALIEAMQENQVTIEGKTLGLPKPFFVIATRNPIETEGVYPLPEAQLDRFMIKSDMGYLGREDELDMLKSKNGDWDEEKVNKVKDDFGLQIRGLHDDVFVSNSVLSYIRDIIFETRNVDELVVGASPRAGEQLLYASKAFALISEKDYVIPDHVKEMARRVLPHRLIVSVEAELEDIDEHHILDDILEERVEAPKGDLSRD